MNIVVANTFHQQVDAVEIEVGSIAIGISDGHQTAEGGGATSVGILLGEGLSVEDHAIGNGQVVGRCSTVGLDQNITDGRSRTNSLVEEDVLRTRGQGEIDGAHSTGVINRGVEGDVGAGAAGINLNRGLTSNTGQQDGIGSSALQGDCTACALGAYTSLSATFGGNQGVSKGEDAVVGVDINGSTSTTIGINASGVTASGVDVDVS